MKFRETPIFTKLLTELLDDDEYKKIQEYLIAMPYAGDIIQGTGGTRKLRWGLPGVGKSGGARFIYYWFAPNDIIHMITLYCKSEQEDLTPEQKKMCKKLTEGYKNE